MKMRKFLPLFLIASYLVQADIEIPETPPMTESIPFSEAPQTLKEGQKKYFTYMTLGVSTRFGKKDALLRSAVPEISYGWRQLNKENSWDARIGVKYRPNVERLYGQYSWFYVPAVTKGAYIGGGIQLGVAHFSKSHLKGNTALNFDLPVTLGYLFSGKETHNFIQMQVSPIVYSLMKIAQNSAPEKISGIPGLYTTIDYGFGF